MTANPNAPVLADASPEDRALVAELAAMREYDAAIPDPAFLAESRRSVLAAAAVATLLAAPNLATPAVDDLYIDPSLCASSWLNALADELYADGAQ
jgi:hypothetical protein